MIDSANYANKIVENLEQKGYTKDMIMGFLEGTLNELKYLENKKVSASLQRTVEETKPKPLIATSPKGFLLFCPQKIQKVIAL